MKIYKKLTITVCSLLFFTIGCIKDQDFSAPTITCEEPSIAVTNTLKQVKEMYTFGGPKVLDNDVVIAGYVVSSDKSGNIYKSISIQDKPENPTSALKIAIDQTDLYTKYNIGRKIYVNLKGLAVGYSFGSVQLGKAVNGELERISQFEVNNYITRSCEVAEITPKKVEISDLNKDYLEMLVEIENVQFKTNELGNSYANIENTSTVNRVLESFTNNCNLKDEVVLRNSGFSDFKNQLLPEGKGSVTGIFSNYYNDYQLYLRNLEDVNLTRPRCEYSSTLEPTLSLLEVKEMYTGSMVEFGANNNYVIEGYVISSDKNGNFKNKLVIQNAVENPTAGIQLLLDTEEIFQQYNIGDKIFVKLDKLYMTENDGVLTIGYPNGTKISKIESEAVGDFIFNSGENYQLTPTEILINETVNQNYESTLVTVKNIQLTENELGSAFTFFSGNSDGTRTLESCNEPIKLSIFTNGNATFANELFPEGSGNITGVLANYLELREKEDVQFNQPYEICPVIIPKIMITEIADPKNSVSARFIELYNAGETEIKLTGWKLNKYINGATSVSGTPLDLSEIIIPVGGFAIIGNTDYKTQFNDTPIIESTYISGNGDDVYELVDAAGNTIDIFGVIGEDGNGTNWEYLDGKAVRNTDVVEPNNLFTISEWTIYSAASNSFITNPNTPQNAPIDFNPNQR